MNTTRTHARLGAVKCTKPPEDNNERKIPTLAQPLVALEALCPASASRGMEAAQKTRKAYTLTNIVQSPLPKLVVAVLAIVTFRVILLSPALVP